MKPFSKLGLLLDRAIERHGAGKVALAALAAPAISNSLIFGPGLIDDYKQQRAYEQLVAQASSIPPPWTLQLQPSASDVAKLEKEAARGEDTNIIAKYQTAYVARHYPELLTNNGPRFVIGSIDDPLLKVRMAQLAANKDDFNQAQNFSEKIRKNEAGGTYSPLTQSITLSPGQCPDCINPGKHKMSCDLPRTPLEVRGNQIWSVFASNHEVAHLLSFNKGIRRAFGTVGSSAWAEHAEENMANTYGALRTVRMLGKEGALYLPILQAELSLQLQPSHVDAVHHSSRSIQSVMDYLKFDENNKPSAGTAKMVAQLQQMDERDVLELAQQLNRPLSPQIYSKYMPALEAAYNTSDPAVFRQQRDALYAQWRQQPGWDHAFPQIADIWTPGQIIPRADQGQDWAKANPYLPKGIPADFNKLSHADPVQAQARLAFSLERRDPSCLTEMAVQLENLSKGQVSAKRLIEGQERLMQSQPAQPTRGLTDENIRNIRLTLPRPPSH